MTSSLIRHKRKHSGEHLYHCEVCNKALSQQSNLIRYQQLRSDERPYVCAVCNKAYSYMNTDKP